METLVIAIHLVAAAAIVGLILLQQGKGAEVGASFGSGGANTMFGPQGSGTVFSRVTAILTAIFFGTSIWLAMLAKGQMTVDVEEGIPSAEIIEQVQPGESDMPMIESSSDIPVTTVNTEAPTTASMEEAMDAAMEQSQQESDIPAMDAEDSDIPQ
jgi:preprotein translocase subunit SecG